MNRATLVGVQIVVGIACGLVGLFLLVGLGNADNRLLCVHAPDCTLEVHNASGDRTSWSFTREGFVDVKIDDAGDAPSLELYFRAAGADSNAEPTRVTFADALSDESALDLREQITAWRVDVSDRPRPLDVRVGDGTGSTVVGYTLVGVGLLALAGAAVGAVRRRDPNSLPLPASSPIP